MNQYVADFVSLIDNTSNLIFNMTQEEATAAIVSGEPTAVRKLTVSLPSLKK